MRGVPRAAHHAITYRAAKFAEHDRAGINRLAADIFQHHSHVLMPIPHFDSTSYPALSQMEEIKMNHIPFPFTCTVGAQERGTTPPPQRFAL